MILRQNSGVVSRKFAARSQPALLTRKLHRPARGLEVGDRARHRLVVRDVERMQARAPALAPDLGRDGLAHCRIEIEDADRAAFLGQPPRDRGADAVRAAGDDDAAILQSAHLILNSRIDFDLR